MIFFDRPFLDAISYYQAHGKKDVDSYDELIEQFEFSNPLFMAPPWKEIFSEYAESKDS